MASLPKLTSPSVLTRLLDEHGLRPDKAFGQNFLIDENIRRKIIAAANLTSEDVVVEVGPGIGTLSQEIYSRVKKLWLIELDKRLIPPLNQTMAGSNNTEIIQADALRFDYSTLNPDPNKMISNLPYNIAAPLIIKMLTQTGVQNFTLMVQDEMARRLAAKPSTKDYGALSVKIAYLSEVKILFKVGEQVFLPKPKVRSAVISINKKLHTKIDKHLIKVVESSFAYRRKSIKRALILSGFGARNVEEALVSSGIEAKQRAQDLELDDFKKLAFGLSEH